MMCVWGEYDIMCVYRKDGVGTDIMGFESRGNLPGKGDLNKICSFLSIPLLHPTHLYNLPLKQQTIYYTHTSHSPLWPYQA